MQRRGKGGGLHSSTGWCGSWEIRVAFCDTNGKLTSFGDAQVDFCLQSCSKPLTYCLARQLQSAQLTGTVHAHVGYEPSGRAFNEFVLNRDGLPHNPLINAGAMMVASMIHPGDEPSKRFDAVLDFYREMSGGHGKIGFDNGVFLSEKHHADRNISLAYYMRENNAYDGKPTPSQLSDHLDLYFQACSITCNCEMLAIMASTIANNGVCPVNNHTVVDSAIIKDVKCIMYSCGMYDFSGQFGFRVGLPAKSGVSGCVMLVIPGVGGLCVWSPRLDDLGNSVRGLEFCLEFSRRTESAYHLFSSHAQQHGTSMHNNNNNSSGQRNESDTSSPEATLYQINQYASKGETEKLKSVSNPSLLGASDYDGRTPLHLACAEGHLDTVQFLLSTEIKTDAKDRWGNTPHDDAQKHMQTLQEADVPDEKQIETARGILELMGSVQQ